MHGMLFESLNKLLVNKRISHDPQVTLFSQDHTRVAQSFNQDHKQK